MICETIQYSSVIDGKHVMAAMLDDVDVREQSR